MYPLSTVLLKKNAQQNFGLKEVQMYKNLNGLNGPRIDLCVDTWDFGPSVTKKKKLACSLFIDHMEKCNVLPEPCCSEWLQRHATYINGYRYTYNFSECLIPRTLHYWPSNTLYIIKSQYLWSIIYPIMVSVSSMYPVISSTVVWDSI